jgi:hypothetical protein
MYGHPLIPSVVDDGGRYGEEPTMNPELFLDLAKQRHAELSRAAETYRLAAAAKAPREPRSRRTGGGRFLHRTATAR